MAAPALFLCSTARADSIESIGIPGGGLVVAEYSGFGETHWNGKYDFPVFIDRNGLWEAIEVAFNMPPNGGLFSLETTDTGQLFADIFGTGIGELWSFHALALPNNPIIFNIGFPNADITTIVYNPPATVTRINEPGGCYYLLIPIILFLLWKREEKCK